jgi:flagellar protein FlbD
MIRLTRLNSEPLILNEDLIEHIDVTPDTVITLTTGQKLMVLEPAEEIIHRVVAFRREIMRNLLCCAHTASAPAGAAEPSGERGGETHGR